VWPLSEQHKSRPRYQEKRRPGQVPGFFFRATRLPGYLKRQHQHPYLLHHLPRRHARRPQKINRVEKVVDRWLLAKFSLWYTLFFGCSYKNE
jgi:hypothetical protein